MHEQLQIALHSNVRQRIWTNTLEEVMSQTGHDPYDRSWYQIGDPLDNQIESQVRRQIRIQLRTRVRDTKSRE